MDNNQNTEKNAVNPKKIKNNLFLVCAILVIVLIIILSQNDANAIWHAIQNADYGYIGIAFLFTLGYWVFTSLSLHIMIKKKAENSISFKDSFTIANSAFFFNGITPFSSGGQPFQIYSYHKCNIKSATSTGVLMMNFIIYQIALNVVSLIALILYFGELSRNVSGFNVLVIIGFSINFIVLIVLILMAISKRFRNICNWFVDKICRIKFLRKHSDAIKEKVNTFVVDFQISFKSLFKSFGLLVFTLLFHITALACQFIIPFFILRALNIELGMGDVMMVMSLSAFALGFMIWIPTPGSSGGAEWAFAELFPALIPTITGAITASATLLWRLLTYYLSIFFGFINFIIFEKTHKERTEVQSED